MKRFIALFIALLSFSVFAQQDQKLANGKWAYYGEEFYQQFDANRKFDRTIFNKIFNQSHTSTKGEFDTLGTQCSQGDTCYSHNSVGYERARKIMFGDLDAQKDHKGTYVVDVYCGKKFYFNDLDTVSNMHTKVNIEHTWPQSKFNGHYPKDQQKSDMHHLYLTDSKANSVRGNSPFGLVASSEDRSAGEGCSNSRYGFTKKGHVYTPPNSHKGNVARALFYFAMHYGLDIDKAQEMILRQWHKSDPVDAAELARHEGIARYQKVRNPFVDHPELVERITDF
jgi:hypothetical protein